MRIWVTGAAGFVGAALVKRLTASGHEVTAILRETTDAFRLRSCTEQVRVFRADLAKPGTYRRELEANLPDCVVHAAWYAVPGKYLDAIENVDDIRSTVELAGACFEIGIQLVGIGTCFEYELQACALREDGAERPTTFYGSAKLAAKNLVMALAKNKGAKFQWARLFYVYGPNEHPSRLIPLLVTHLRQRKPIALRTHGHQIRDYMHVDDVAAGLACLVGRAGQDVVNLGSGTPLTVRKIATEIAKAEGAESLLQFAADDTPLHEPPFVCAETSKLRKLGFQPMHDIITDARNRLL